MEQYASREAVGARDGMAGKVNRMAHQRKYCW